MPRREFSASVKKARHASSTRTASAMLLGVSNDARYRTDQGEAAMNVDEDRWEPSLFIGLLTGLPAALCMWALIAAAFAFSMGWLKP